MKKVFGPGLLFAATAIGVSHLVQSTKAGAEYGWSFLWIILLANFLKFPFFEFGTRYAHATGESLIAGYARMGRWAVWLYAIATLFSMFTVTGAVSMVTAGMMIYVFELSYSIQTVTSLLFVVCFIWLAIGRFKVLDISIKLITAILTISTIVAFGMATADVGLQWEYDIVEWGDASVWLFTIALIGWMPTAVDLSVWNSIWTVEKRANTHEKGSLKTVLLDFNIGYWLSAITAIAFLGLGAMLMHNSNISFPESAVGFTSSLIDIYSQTLGRGAVYVISIAAFAAMFSTTLSVFDGYGRTSVEIFKALWSEVRFGYWIAVLVVAVGGWLLVWQYSNRMSDLVELAMIISFVLSPIIAYFNTRLVHSSTIAQTHRPARWLSAWAVVGIAGLVVLSILFAYFMLK